MPFDRNWIPIEEKKVFKEHGLKEERESLYKKIKQSDYGKRSTQHQQ
jgi:hypothetical protein